MAKSRKGVQQTKRRSLFRELMTGVEGMREHREGRITLSIHQVEPIRVPPVTSDFLCETGEALHMSR